MNANIISAIFDSQAEAEAAVRDLRNQGIDDNRLSIIARHEGRTTTSDGSGEETGDGDGDGMVKGALGGAGVGALLGIGALLIPGVGPFAAAGAIAAAAVPEAAAIGAGIGAVGGGLTGLLTDHGVSDEDAGYYEGRIKEGGTFVSVDTAEGALNAATAREILMRNGGHNASQPRMASAY